MDEESINKIHANERLDELQEQIGRLRNSITEEGTMDTELVQAVLASAIFLLAVDAFTRGALDMEFSDGV